MRSLKLSALACLGLATILWVGPYVARDDLFYDDAAHHVFWLYQYSEPSLFPDDLTVEYFKTSAPPGYRALYAALAQVADLMLAAKVMSGVLLLLSGFLAWKLGEALSEEFGAFTGFFAVVALILLLPVSQQKDLLPALAFQRTFAMPLTLLALWALVSRQYAWIGVSWLLSALFYPVMLPVLGLTAGVVLLRELIREHRMPRHWIFNGMCGVAALALALFATPIPEGIGPMLSYEQAIAMPEFGPDGRLRLYVDRYVGNWVTGHRTGLGWSPGVLLAIAIAVAIPWFSRRGKAIPFAAWVMLCVGVGLWLVMRLFPDQTMFELYLPNRHSRWAIAAFAIVAFAVAGQQIVMAIQSRAKMAGKAPNRRLSYALAIAALIVIAVPLGAHAVNVLRKPVDRDLERTYQFIASLPKDTLVAAHPTLANFIPVRSRRSVLTSTEAAMAWMSGYYARVKPRVEAALRAAYATSFDELDAQTQPFGVDVFVTGPSVWKQKDYFAPFDQLVQELWNRGEREGFVLERPTDARVIFRSGDYYVVRIGADEKQ